MNREGTRWGPRVRRWLVALAGVALFLGAVRALGTASEALAADSGPAIARIVGGPGSALGLGWLATYVLMSGSVVATLAVGLVQGGVLAMTEGFLVISGSRLGAAGFVVLVGLLDHLRSGRRGALRESLGLGALAFLVTHSVYLPGTAVGLAAVELFGEELAGVLDLSRVPVPTLAFTESGIREITDVVGVLPVFVFAVGLLFVALHLVDRAARTADPEVIRARYLSHLDHTWVALGVGLLLTLATASVSFSVGVAVPFYNRGYVSRRQIVPYLLGANVGTLGDTFLATLVLESAASASALIILAAGILVVTSAALVRYPAYYDLVDRGLEAVASSRAAFLAVGASLLLVPLVLSSLGRF